MKGQASVLFQMLGGHVKLSELYSRKGLVPGEVIIQRRPRRRQREEWSAAQQEAREQGRAALKRAEEEYRDPDKKAAWAAEYNRLSAICQKKNNRHINGGKTVGGYELPYRLYDFVRQQILRQAYGHRGVIVDSHS